MVLINKDSGGGKMYKYYDSEKLELEKKIEDIIIEDSTVTEAVLKLRGITKVSIGEGYSHLSSLEPFRELKDGIAYTKTSKRKNNCLGFQCFEDSDSVMLGEKKYALHRNGEGMIYLLEEEIEWYESKEKPENVLKNFSDMRWKN